MTAGYLKKLRKVTAWWLLNQALMLMTTISKSEKVSDDINAAHSYGRNALSDSVLFCLMTYGCKKMRFYSELQSHLSFTEWLKGLSFLTPTHGDLCHGISAWFTVCLFHRTILNPVFHGRIQTFKQKVTGLHLGTFWSWGSSEWRHFSGGELSSVQYQSVCVCVCVESYWENTFRIILMLLF